MKWEWISISWRKIVFGISISLSPEEYTIVLCSGDEWSIEHRKCETKRNKTKAKHGNGLRIRTSTNEKKKQRHNVCGRVRERQRKIERRRKKRNREGGLEGEEERRGKRKTNKGTLRNIKMYEKRHSHWIHAIDTGMWRWMVCHTWTSCDAGGSCYRIRRHDPPPHFTINVLETWIEDRREAAVWVENEVQGDLEVAAYGWPPLLWDVHMSICISNREERVILNLFDLSKCRMGFWLHWFSVLFYLFH